MPFQDQEHTSNDFLQQCEHKPVNALPWDFQTLHCAKESGDLMTTAESVHLPHHSVSDEVEPDLNHSSPAEYVEVPPENGLRANFMPSLTEGSHTSFNNRAPADEGDQQSAFQPRAVTP